MALKRLGRISGGILLTFLLLFLFGARPLFSLANTPSPANQNRFSFVYEVSIKDFPEGSKFLEIWAPLARNDEHQVILKREIEVAHPYRVLTDSQYGNEILYLRLDHPTTQPMSFRVTYEVETQGKLLLADSAEASKGASKTGEGMQLHLSSNQYMVINEEIRQLARDVTAGQESDLDKARAIYDYVIQNMKYDKTGEGWGRGDTLHACSVGKGNCTDFHSLFISLARGVAIPARFKIGAQIPWDKTEGNVGYHCWAEFYLAGEGWIPVDASEAWKNSQYKEYYFGSVDPGKFTISTGRDLALRPRPKGGLINFFIYPYVEVDGKPFEAVETRFLYKRKVTG